MINRLIVSLIIGMFLTGSVFGQDLLSSARITGNFQLDAQYYTKDPDIGAEHVPEKILSNSFFFMNYNLGDFNAGFRYEAYLNPILGYDSRYQGTGFAYRYLEYNTDFISVTAGNFYEQFGSGMIFRSYEERQLGIDNSMEGARIKIRPTEGLEITGLIGKQRQYWNYGKGIVRGADLNLSVNRVFEGLLNDETQLNFGASAVSKYQQDNDPTYNLPENVMAVSTRFSLNGYNYSVEAEYAHKNNDPNATNGFNYNPGNGLIVSGSYFGEGYGLNLNFHGIDNMDFRSDRYATLNDLTLSFIPPLTRQQLYRLATLYPYATQLNGEIGLQAEFTYTFDKKSLLGGKYGTTLLLNYSRVQSIDTTRTSPVKYKSDYLNPANIFSSDRELYFQDINIEVQKKFSRDFKTKFSYINTTYNKDVVEVQGAAEFGKVYSNLAVAELQFRLSSRHSLRIELQHLWSTQDSTLKVPDNINGNWAMALAEYTISPGWFFSLWDEYNYGNQFEEKQLHYVSGSVAYVHKATRVSLNYGRQRGGLLCVGGVCRPVPASNGFTFSVTTSF